MSCFAALLILLAFGAGIVLGQLVERDRVRRAQLPVARATRRHLKMWRSDRIVLAVGNRRSK